ncbi:UNVERIFIED_CONTAM: hypothetical protein Slati_0432800 [Sesamum latifolium]|uniref:Uncharacterized protein n=1 Tax=Sesamum latifolium TaxID=2727402 RepID=A0AAW2XZ81_9LAMI
MPTYVMACFLLPSTLCRELEGLMANFLWDNGDVSRIHWLSWDKVCTSRREGGSGFQKLGALNRALLVKQLWRIIVNPNALLSCLLKCKYFPNSYVLQAEAGVGSSYTWRSILAARELLVAGTQWQIGSGGSVRI